MVIGSNVTPLNELVVVKNDKLIDLLSNDDLLNKVACNDWKRNDTGMTARIDYNYRFT